MQNKIYAGFFIRLAAYLLDIFILGIGMAGIKLVYLFSHFDTYAVPIFFSFTFVDVICYLIAASYFVVLTYFNGQTLGKMAFNICVVDVDGRLGFFQVLIRETFGRYLSAIILNIGYLLIIPDEKKRALHDRLCSTQVVYKDTAVNNGLNRF